MRVHAIIEADLLTAAASARTAEALGFDGVWTTETDRDPFLPLVPVTAASERLEIGTAIAVALPRSPWQLAQLANDLQRASEGRFRLGLGSQVRAHVERRFSAAWDHPARRMRELVLALRAIWGSWQRGEPLEFKGEFYTHTLSAPMFDPDPHPFGDPPVLLAAVGSVMARVAGEVADGILVHGFTTPAYLRDVVVPALESGADLAGRDVTAIEVVRPLFLVTGRSEEEMAAAAAVVRERLAFYGSTRNYRPVLEHHGWGDLQSDLEALARRRAWTEMAALIDDELLAEFAVVAPLEQLADAILERYGEVVDRVSFRLPTEHHEEWTQVVAGLRRHRPE